MPSQLEIHAERPLSGAEIEVAVGIFGGVRTDDPLTDPAADLRPLPSDAEERAAPPPDEPCR